MPRTSCVDCGSHDLWKNTYGHTQPRCKKCHAAFRRKKYSENPEPYRNHAKVWRYKNPEKVAQQRRTAKAKRVQQKSHLKRKFGISLEEYDALVNEHQNRCAICGSGPTEIGSKKRRDGMHIDHCHKTNRVRGLLCFRCNAGLGSFNDDPVLLMEAIRYLKKHDNL